MTTAMSVSLSAYAGAPARSSEGGGASESRSSAPSNSAPSYSAPRSEPAPAPSYSAPRSEPAPAPSYSAPRSQPVSRPAPAPAPVSRAEPVSRPEPVTRPVPAPVSRPEPVSRPAQPSQPVSQPSRPAQPVSRPTQPVSKPTQPVTKPTQPVTKPTQPVTKPTQPVMKPTSPVVKPTRPIARPTKTVGVNNGQKPAQPVKIVMPKNNVVTFQKPSYLTNPTTIQNMNASKTKSDEFRRDPRIVNIINISRNNTVINNYNVNVRARYGQINTWHTDGYYHNYYGNYWSHGFYGGYFYPVIPCYDITPYFYYPMVYWMYAPTYDNTYWSGWYGDTDYVSYPVDPFPYREVYYPTDVIRDLAIEVSAFSAERQSYFRKGMNNLTESLAQQLANDLNASIELGQNEVTVNHYQNLGNNAIIVEGSVDIDRDAEDIHVHSAFKALLDLNDQGNTLAFMPIGQDPTAADLTSLSAINDRIQALGGNPFQADVEPTVASAENDIE
jgi:hypothetical protein